MNELQNFRNQQLQANDKDSNDQADIVRQMKRLEQDLSKIKTEYENIERGNK